MVRRVIRGITSKVTIMASPTIEKVGAAAGGMGASIRLAEVVAMVVIETAFRVVLLDERVLRKYDAFRNSFFYNLYS